MVRSFVTGGRFGLAGLPDKPGVLPSVRDDIASTAARAFRIHPATPDLGDRPPPALSARPPGCPPGRSVNEKLDISCRGALVPVGQEKSTISEWPRGSRVTLSLYGSYLGADNILHRVDRGSRVLEGEGGLETF